MLTTAPPPDVLIPETTSESGFLGVALGQTSRPDFGSSHIIASGGATLWQSSAFALPVYFHALPVALPVF